MVRVSETMHDQELVSRILAGDKPLFAKLLERYETQVAATLSRLVPERHVQDVAQEVFLALYDSLESLDACKGVGGFIATLCTRRAHDFWRKAANRETPFSQHAEDASQWLDGQVIAWGTASTFDLAQIVEQRNLLDKVLARFSATDRMIMVLVWLEEHTVAEAAKILGISLPNAKIRVYRCRKRLRTILGNLTGGQS